VVPGVTAGIGPAYAGIPGYPPGDGQLGGVRSTGHDDPAKPRVSGSTGRLWLASPARWSSTWAVRQLPEIARRLIDGGRSAQEPAALVQRGTWPDQRAVLGTLATIAELAESERIRAPTVTVFGAVAVAGESRWPGSSRRPLHGVRVAVTARRAQ